MRYFTFGYFEYSNSELVKTGNGLYYAGFDKSIDQMKAIARRQLKDPQAVITLQGIKELTQEDYETGTASKLDS